MLGSRGWVGDLRALVTYAWSDESTEIVCVATGNDDGTGSVWLNMYHLRDCDLRLVWYWARHAAAYRAPLDVLYADQLAALHQTHDAAAHGV